MTNQYAQDLEKGIETELKRLRREREKKIIKAVTEIVKTFLTIGVRVAGAWLFVISLQTMSALKPNPPAYYILGMFTGMMLLLSEVTV